MYLQNLITVSGETVALAPSIMNYMYEAGEVETKAQ